VAVQESAPLDETGRGQIGNAASLPVEAGNRALQTTYLFSDAGGLQLTSHRRKRCHQGALHASVQSAKAKSVGSMVMDVSGQTQRRELGRAWPAAAPPTTPNRFSGLFTRLFAEWSRCRDSVT